MVNEKILDELNTFHVIRVRVCVCGQIDERKLSKIKITMAWLRHMYHVAL